MENGGGMTHRLPETTARTVPSYGLRAVGGFGVRGWRAHCGHCGFLSRLYTNIRGAQHATQRHRCAERAAAA